MRGRKPDSKGRQKAKGYPRQRATKKERATADQRAGLLSQVATVSPGSLISPEPAAPKRPAAVHPKFLADSKLQEALAIWAELEPDLRRFNLLQPLDRHTFSMYCVHMADWIIATRDIQKRGHWKNVKNVNGDLLPRLNPMLKVRELAERHIIDIGARFGLDPSNRYRLLRDQSAAPKAADLFNQAPHSGEPTPPPSNDENQLPSPLGLMDDLSTKPPEGRLPN